MTAKELNPLEEMVEEMSDVYVDMVFELAEELAPVRPWWHADLTAEQKLWRYVGTTPEEGLRSIVMPWLEAAAVAMGAPEGDMLAAAGMVERIFTDPAATDLIPPALVAQIPVELLELVQGGGPKDAMKHLVLMERMVARREAAIALLSNTDQPVPGPMYGEAAPEDDLPPML